MIAPRPSEPHPLSLTGHRESAPPSRLSRWAGPSVERLLSLKRLQSLYGMAGGTFSGRDFLKKALDALHITSEVQDEDLAQIPRTGPVILVSNHPFGVVDPMVILTMVLSIRPDAKVMGNRLLNRIQELRDVLIPVNPFGGNGAARENLRAVRECVRLLHDGSMLCIFPAGTVSHLQRRPGRFCVTDPEWNPMAARLSCRTDAVVIPAHVSGRNSLLFQAAGLIHPMLRTALLPRETVRLCGARVRVRMGPPIPPERLRRFRTDDERIRYLRSRTYVLAVDGNRPDGKTVGSTSSSEVLQPLIPVQPSRRLESEIAVLSPHQVLVENDRFLVLQARAEQIPALLMETARLRELTFREEEEGTGLPLDTDRFDSLYRHLILWDREKRAVAGGYRMGLSEEILPLHGPRGFYTHTLFHYGRRFLDRITPAMELGRSFVCSDYQKTYQPLFLLWKGIARFVSLNPEYRYLFGPVSITRAYRSVSRLLMADFLRENNRGMETALQVRPRNPLRRGLTPGSPELRAFVNQLTDIRDLSELISQIEHDRKGVPVLIRQYLKLGGRVLGFNVDPRFRDTLDALVLVDLTQTEPRTLCRYMGEKEAEGFLRYHGHGPMARCA